VKGRCLYRTPLWQIVFGPAGALRMGSERNCPGQAPGFAEGSPTGHRAIASQKSQSFIAAAAAFGQGACKAKCHSLMRTLPVGTLALAPDGEPSKKISASGGAAVSVLSDSGAGRQGSPAVNRTGDVS
jgi:hypothetical protein